MISCTRKLHFCAGHRVLGHEGKCANPHGHNYTVLLEAVAPLDPIGRVVDFSVLKDRVGRWIEENWDHGFIVSHEDQQLGAALMAMEAKWFATGFNPTAENIADWLLRVVCPRVLPVHVVVRKVTVWETENCFAVAELEGR